MTASFLPRIAAGETDLVADCIDHYAPLLWSIALRRSDSREDAEDAVQDIFIEIWKNAGRFDESIASEKAFVTMIARRRLIDRQRRSNRRPRLEPLTDHEPRRDDGDDRRIESAAEAALASKALAQLDPKERSVVLLATYQGFSHAQIAERTGLPLGTVKTYVRRGMARVRDILESVRPPRVREVRL